MIIFWPVRNGNAMKIIFKISGGILAALSDAEERFEIKATSGRSYCLNNPTQECLEAAKVGPIPLGIYYLNPGELSDPNIIGDFLRRLTGDWGDWRVPLHPDSSTNTNKRGGFFIHGGGIPGSQGCIDIGGGVFGNVSTNKLEDLIKRSAGWIRVEVIP